MKITERTHNIITGEIVDIEREETEYEKDMRIEAEKQNKLAEKAATEKAALLARLGLTEDELKTILG